MAKPQLFRDYLARQYNFLLGTTPPRNEKIVQKFSNYIEDNQHDKIHRVFLTCSDR